eukprot:jgi/Hompol1/986/HPOL_002625-RA
MESAARLSYANKLILAPMVRVGTTPMRLATDVCADTDSHPTCNGPDIVYSPEIVDRRLMRSVRVVNETLGTIDYVDESTGGLNLRIHPSEQGRLVVQIGSANPEQAVQAALKVAGDVDGIDLNCGCPKKFSTSGGMGSALLERPDLLESILLALVRNLSIPVTCKIRLLDAKDGKTSMERTVELMQRLEKTQIAAIGVHCRYVHERPRQPAHWDAFETLATAVSIPVIANGDLWNWEDIHRFKASSGKGISSFMIARGAQDNVSVFRKEGPLPIWEVMKEYFRLAGECGLEYYATKFVLLQMWGTPDGSPFRQRLVRCKTLEEISALYQELEYCKGVITMEEATTKRLTSAVDLRTALEDEKPATFFDTDQ